MRKLLAGMFILAVLSFFSHSAIAAGDPPLLLRFPTVSKTQIVFNYGGHLWIVSRDGGDARRLTSGTGEETVPSFSPDGTMVAFTGEYDGNRDVFVVQATGGVPRRLTYHPADERVLGRAPDGKSVLYLSWGNSSVTANLNSTLCPWRAGFPRSCQSRLPRRLRFLQTALTWRTFLMGSGKRLGSVITAARPRPSGLPI